MKDIKKPAGANMAGLLHNPSFRFEDLGTSFSRTQQPFVGKYADWSATITRSPYIIPPGVYISSGILNHTAPISRYQCLVPWGGFMDGSISKAHKPYDNYWLSGCGSLYDYIYVWCKLFFTKVIPLPAEGRGMLWRNTAKTELLYHISETVIDKNWADSFLLRICQYHIYFYKSDIVVASHSPMKISFVPSAAGWRSIVDLSENWISYL